jgi:autoinducer 2-degrading protein
MLIVHVDIHVVPERVEDFIGATRTNAYASMLEAGVLRFDVVQDREDPTHFILIEVYRNKSAVALHKETPHYAVWRDTVADWMAQPRTSTKFRPIKPTRPRAWRALEQ